MNKDQLKKYISEAIDAMSTFDLEALLPTQEAPDLYSMAKELIAMRGEMKKLSNSSLKLNHHVQSMVENATEQEKVQAEKLADLQASIPSPESKMLKTLLNQLIDQDDLQSRTAENLNTLPELKLFGIQQFKTQFAAWQKGYEMTNERWQTFMKSVGLKKTGAVGQVFDPIYHEAIAVARQADIDNNIIVETEVMGYIYQQQIIRIAKVVVNKVA